MRRVAMAFIAATVGTAVLAGTAQAATLTITPDKPCYITGDTLTATGTGFTANNSVAFSLDTRPIGQLFADPVGTVVGTFELVRMKGIRTHTLTATDASDPALTASASYMATTPKVDVRPANASAGKKLRINGRGMVGGKKVYMHVRGPHHYKSDTKIARTKAPCGTFKTRRSIVPASARPGRYEVWWDGKRRFSRKTEPHFGGTLTVTRTFG